ACPRIGGPRTWPQNEDCLTLNVFRPSTPPPTGQKLPVMVFIHGGGNQQGDSRSYDGAPLAQTAALAPLPGATVVTVNHRLNVFGWLAHPLLSAEGGGSSGNYGILDIVQALQWVHDNIGAWNGDPAHVMLFGQSAGSADVMATITSPRSAGLVSAAGA